MIRMARAGRWAARAAGAADMPHAASLAVRSMIVLPMLAVPGLARGQASSAVESDPVMSHIDAMRRELDKLREDNQAMKSEIDNLRAATDDNWLTEARADEIRGLVQDVLADADVRSSLLNDGVMAGWADHFFLASADATDADGLTALVDEAERARIETERVNGASEEILAAWKTWYAEARASVAKLAR